jgi:hypothetical protein
VGSFHPLIVLSVNHLMRLEAAFLGCYGMELGLGCVRFFFHDCAPSHSPFYHSMD